MRVLVIEDEPKMRRLIDRALIDAGYSVSTAADGLTGANLATREPFDAIVLDVMLPHMDGFAVVERIRAESVWTPVIMLTARDAVADRVKGLDGGADDYLVKPFAFTELLSRLRALLRRGSPERPALLRCGPLDLDPATHVVRCLDQPVELSAREFSLLEFMLRRAGQVLSRTTILEHVWDYNYDGFSNVVDVYVKNLRDKIDRPFEVELIHTVRGAGYRLSALE